MVPFGCRFFLVFCISNGNEFMWIGSFDDWWQIQGSIQRPVLQRTNFELFAERILHHWTWLLLLTMKIVCSIKRPDRNQSFWRTIILCILMTVVIKLLMMFNLLRLRLLTSFHRTRTKINHIASPLLFEYYEPVGSIIK